MGCELSVDKSIKTFIVNTVSQEVIPISTQNQCKSKEDIFISHENDTCLVKAKCIGVFGLISKFVKNIVWGLFSPLLKILDSIQKDRCFNDFERVKNRNYAKNNDEITRYHKSILFDENNPDEKKIFRYNFSKNNGEKPLVVLFMGNEQTHLWSEDSCGMKKLYEKLKAEDKVDVVLFRVGNATDDIKHKLFLSNDCSLSTDIVYQHSVNVLEDIISGKGLFQGKNKPSKISFVGYSWGGGTVDKLLNEDWQKINTGIPVSETIQIDAIHLGVSNISTPVTRRPNYSQRHLNIFQPNYDFLNGSHQEISREDESMVLTDENFSHNNIDDHNVVLSRVYRFINVGIVKK